MKFEEYKQYLVEESLVDRIARKKEEKEAKKEIASGNSPNHKEFPADFNKYVSVNISEEANVTIEVSDDSKYFNQHKAFAFLVKYTFGNMKGYVDGKNGPEIFTFDGATEKGGYKELMSKLSEVSKNLTKKFKGIEDAIEEEFAKAGIKYTPIKKEDPVPKKKELEDLD
jgi:hypothetical protein